MLHGQGSFALGLATRPVSEDEDYDVDAVCELQVSKATVTQQQLKEALGYELRLYAQARQMRSGPERKRRCWTLRYADEAQFHIDVLPAVPDGPEAQKAYARYGIANPWVSTSIAITDEKHPRFRELTDRS